MPYVDQYVGGSDWQASLAKAAQNVAYYPDAILRSVGLTTSDNNPNPTGYLTPTTVARQVNTVEIDGGSSLFDDMKRAAGQTLLGALSNAINRDEPQITQVRQPVANEPMMIAGFPAAGVIAVGVVATVIYWKFG